MPDASPSLTPQAIQVLRLLDERVDELAARITERVQAAYAVDPVESEVPAEDLAGVAGAMAHLALAALQEQRVATDEELAQAAIFAERRARQGISLETLLRGFRIAASEGLASVQELAAQADLDARTTLALATGLLDWIDAVSVEAAAAHRGVEVALARRDQQQRVSFLHALIRGTVAPHRIEEEATTFRIDPAADHIVVRARPGAAAGADELERLFVPSTWSPGLVAVIDEEVVAVLPAMPGDVPVAAGAGPAVPLSALPRSYRDAGRALDTAAHFGLLGCHDLGELGLRAAVLADDAVGELLLARYVAPLALLGDFGDELLKSLRAYVDHQQNIDAAARELFVHANTLRHRLSRYEEATGANLRRVEDIAGIWWALTLSG